MKNCKQKKVIIWIASIAVCLALIIGGCGIYVADYYRADTAAIEAFGMAEVEVRVLDDGVTAYGPADAKVGFLFYPGGKVEHTAYDPLMRQLAAKGVLCVLLEMPFRLAVLDMNAADGVPQHFPEVERWYIGGHSLGGSMAACYAEANPDAVEGLILLGAYSSKNLSEVPIQVLSIYGSEDKVMNREKYDKYKENLPATYTEIEIKGGCHAYFGMYGAQDGDGTPTITAEEQIALTADYITAFLTENKDKA